MCRVANDGESILPQDPWLQGRSTFLQLHQRCVSPSISLTHKSESASGLEIPTLDSLHQQEKTERRQQDCRCTCSCSFRERQERLLSLRSSCT